jgi:gamma-glutamyltranspeptidase
VDGPEAQHLQIKAMKLVLANVYRCVAEPSSLELPPAQMLDDGYLATRARLIRMNQAQDVGAGIPVKGGTIYLRAADAGLSINVEASMQPATVQSLQALGHRIDMRQDSCQGFGAGQFIWRMGAPQVHGYLAASDARRDGLAAGF